jgi:hypothetical protein
MTIEEIQLLAAHAINMDQAFERIKHDLEFVDKNDYKDKFGNPIAKLAPTWAGYQKRYTDLLWFSRTSATKTEGYIRDFVEVIIPTILDPDSTQDDKIADITEFIGRPNPNGAKIVKGQTQSQAFTELQQDVETFTHKFSTFADDQGTKITTEITGLNTEIAALNKEIKDCQKVVEQMGIALGITVGVGGIALVGAIASIAALGPAAPGVIAGILIAGIGAAITELSQIIVNVKRMNAATEERNEKQNRVDELNKQLAILARLKATLQRSEEDAQNISGRLDGFSGMWGNVAHDAALLLSYDLQNIATNKTLQSRIEFMRTTYTALAGGLAVYATTIDGSGIKAAAK